MSKVTQLRGSPQRVVEADPFAAVGAEPAGPRQSKESRLLKLVFETTPRFFNDGGVGFVVFEGFRAHRCDASLRRSLRALLFRKAGEVISEASLSEVVLTLEAHAIEYGEKRDVPFRIGGDGRTFIEIDHGSYSVHVDGTGYHVTQTPDAVFYTTPQALPLPEPVAGANFAEIFNYLAIHRSDRPLVLSWLVNAIRPGGEYPILILTGEQGSGKTATARFIKQLVDPDTDPIENLPQREDDLGLACRESRVVVFDNVSGISRSVSDSLCKVATGAAIKARRFFGQSERVRFTTSNALIITGIDADNVAPDLADRSYVIRLEPRTDRVPEDELLRTWKGARPRLLGALYEAAATGLRRADIDAPAALPRLARAGFWAFKCAPAFGEYGNVIEAMDGNRNASHVDSVESNAFVSAIADLLNDRRDWTGTATALLKEVNARVSDRPRDWPRDARRASDTLRRFAPSLLAIRIKVEWIRTGRARTIRLRVNPIEAADEGAVTGDLHAG